MEYTEGWKMCKYAIETLLSIEGVRLGSAGCSYLPDGAAVECSLEVMCRDGQGAAKAMPLDIKIPGDMLNDSIRLLCCLDGQHPARALPEVNYFAKALKELVCREAEKLDLTLVEDQKKFTVVLTHDVDNINDRNIYVFAHRVMESLRLMAGGKTRQGIKYLVFAAGRLLGGSSPYMNFEKYIEMENSYGFRSSFYFMNGKRGRLGARYSLEEAAEAIRLLEERGWEVGLHTNYFSYNDTRRIAAEKEAIEAVSGRDVCGCRNHYLRLDIPSSWLKLRDAGLKYDTTLGYAGAAGFRAGIAYPFYPYDMENNRTVDILEIPMVIMDSAVFNRKFSAEETWKEIVRVLDEVKKVNGTAAINFHSEVLYEEEFPGWKDVYERILRYIWQNGGRGVTARQVFHELTDGQVSIDDIKGEVQGAVQN